jgi:hypothetical protein
MAAPIDTLVQELNAIKWRNKKSITPGARSLIQVFIGKLRNVLADTLSASKTSPGEAFLLAYSAAPPPPRRDEVVDRLFQAVKLPGAGVRETILNPVASYLLWQETQRFADFPNPWEPLLELYRMGYTSDFDISPDFASVDLVVGFRGGEQRFRLTS